MRLAVRLLSIGCILWLLGWLLLFHQLNWIWGRPPTAAKLVLLSLPLVAWGIGIVTSFAAQKGPGLLWAGILLTTALLGFLGYAIAKDGDSFRILPLPYIAAWWIMYHSLPGREEG